MLIWKLMNNPTLQLRAVLVVCAAFFAGAIVQADPILNFNYSQNGNEMSLSWSWENLPDHDYAYTISAQTDVETSAYNYSLLGWWPDLSSGEIHGTIEAGWLDIPDHPDYTDTSVFFLISGSNRTRFIFTPGEHTISFWFYDGAPYPDRFNPQGAYGVGEYYFKTSYFVADPAQQVPDDGNTLLLAGVPLLALALFRKKR